MRAPESPSSFSKLRRAVVLGVTWIAWAGCRSDGDAGPPRVGSNSNWFAICTDDSECGALSCLCGACSGECETDADCADLEAARCAPADAPAARSQCIAGGSAGGLCLPRCNPGECEPWQACVDGACIAAVMPDVPFCAAAEEPARSDRQREDELLAAVQALRANGGAPCGQTPVSPAPLLRLDPRLTCAARIRALDAAASGTVGETDSQGRTAEDRLAEVAYDVVTWGESFAIAARSAEEALDFMRQDAGSCARLSEPGFVDVGVGVASDVAIVVLGSQ